MDVMARLTVEDFKARTLIGELNRAGALRLSKQTARGEFAGWTFRARAHAYNDDS
jgi:hypothetical protein